MIFGIHFAYTWDHADDEPITSVLLENVTLAPGAYAEFDVRIPADAREGYVFICDEQGERVWGPLEVSRQAPAPVECSGRRLRELVSLED